MGEVFQRAVVDTHRLPLFCFFVALIVTFVFTRINVRLIRAQARWWFKNVSVGETHVHHVVFGVILMMASGVTALLLGPAAEGWIAVTAALFGIGSGLVLDEFALLLHLRDVYWAEAGRTSVDAVFVAIAVTGLLLLGARPLGWDDVTGDFWLAVLVLVVNLVFAVVTLLKGKIWSGLLGVFVPVFGYVGAVRLARPGSPWARWFYGGRPGKLAKALHREERWRRPVIKAKIAVQEFVSGRHMG
ncbi:hypothetical protein GT755_20590 [Herbidospora sp. NEAU-GS84]|uniref:Uncharacterized protein n=1 Tax=Herbidospora solisilvae TaxID=2696284 RepID=A0A7C9NIP3_9ACTN|nr:MULTISPECIES: hypothetical protein [Herbidospora]NAS24078.1 hypothetical protein [Herbidospora solisilvae]GLX98119.1 hypothetical protein Hesp01_60690 [Herbidospora sp. NBRC 101105]